VQLSAGEGRLAVALTPDHAFVDQLLAHRRDGCGLDPEGGRNVAGLVRTRSEFATDRRYFCWSWVKRLKRTGKKLASKWAMMPGGAS
jgi:hypothetical protein